MAGLEQKEADIRGLAETTLIIVDLEIMGSPGREHLEVMVIIPLTDMEKEKGTKVILTIPMAVVTITSRTSKVVIRSLMLLKDLLILKQGQVEVYRVW